jgi:hypothetical protein
MRASTSSTSARISTRCTFDAGGLMRIIVPNLEG